MELVVTLAIIAVFRDGKWSLAGVSARGVLRPGAAETLRYSRHGSSSSCSRSLLARSRIPKLYIVGGEG